MGYTSDSVDTTTKETECTYDRVVFRKAFTEEDFTGEWDLFNFKRGYGLSLELTEEVSDHFPVWALFYTNRDTD